MRVRCLGLRCYGLAMLQTRAAIAEAPWPANSAIVLMGSVGGQRPERGIFRRDADRENRGVEKGKDQRKDRQAERQRHSRNLAGDNCIVRMA